MAERLAHDERVMAIDRIFRELTWHGQKHAIRTLTRPEIGLTMPQMITLLAIHDSGSCRMGTLADATQHSGGTLTGIVDSLGRTPGVLRVGDTVDILGTNLPAVENAIVHFGSVRTEVLRALWRELAGADVPYDPVLYQRAYERLLRHRRAEAWPLHTRLPTGGVAAYDFRVATADLVPTAEEA